MVPLSLAGYRGILEKLRYALQEQRLIASTLKRAAPSTVRRITRPSVGEFLEAAGTIHISAVSSLRAVLGGRYDEARQAVYTAEYGSVIDELSSRYGRLRRGEGSLLSEAYSIGEETGLLVYSLLRFLRPRIVLETGVANGHSTFLTLRALSANGTGTLYSTDVEVQSGGLLTADDKHNWHFRPLRKAHVRADFDALLAEVGMIDFFAHDSEHTYAWQMREYETAWSRGSGSAMLFSDDVDASYAFLDFCDRRRVAPIVLFDSRKIVGLAPLGSRKQDGNESG